MRRRASCSSRGLRKKWTPVTSSPKLHVGEDERSTDERGGGGDFCVGGGGKNREHGCRRHISYRLSKWTCMDTHTHTHTHVFLYRAIKRTYTHSHAHAALRTHTYTPSKLRLKNYYSWIILWHNNLHVYVSRV